MDVAAVSPLVSTTLTQQVDYARVPRVRYPNPFRKAVEEGDEAAIQALPRRRRRIHQPGGLQGRTSGKPITAALPAAAVLRVFEDFRYNPRESTTATAVTTRWSSRPGSPARRA